ncbi:hypothetical protein RV09_GL001678 [Enterococcus moraviensis]|nr:hypothetical protein RV09_GL001678 [Enterococcus moraviensis]
MGGGWARENQKERGNRSEEINKKIRQDPSQYHFNDVHKLRASFMGLPT